MKNCALKVNNRCSVAKNKDNNFSYSDLPSYVTITHVNAHLESLVNDDKYKKQNCKENTSR